jgi:hypothetical protein
MNFVDNIINTINNYDNSKNKYDISLQLIIFEYTYSTCYDCKKILINDEKEYSCNGCHIVRCKFHYCVNAVKKCCVLCKDNCNLGLMDIYDCDFNLYSCIYCGYCAVYGYENNIILCDECIFFHKEYSHKEYSNIIYFGSSCNYKKNNCCGVGWFKNKDHRKVYCMYHKDENCNYNFTMMLHYDK